MANPVVLAVALPLLAAFLVPSISRLSSSLARYIGPVLMLVLAWLLAVAFLEQTVHTGTVLAIGNFPAPQGIVFVVDRLALLFAFAVVFLALLLWPWARQDQEDDELYARRLSLTLLLVAASVGMALSGDLFNLYVFYELVAVASYGLVAAGDRRPSGASQLAAYRYLLLSALGSVLALLGIALIYFSTGTLNLAHLASLRGVLDSPLGLVAFALILLGFGVKAELFPVNSWVPEVYRVSSARVSGLLAGLVSKLAVLVIIKLMLMAFSQPEAYQLILVLGMLGVLVGELSALRANDLPRMLAWSSIAQLGLVFIAFSVDSQAGLLAGLAVALHHLVAKPALFLIAARWGGNLKSLYGAAWVSPLMAAWFVILALSMVGVPPFPGFWAKFLLLSGLAGEMNAMAYLAIAVVLIMTVVEANYLFRVIFIFYGRSDKQQPAPSVPSGHDLFSTSVLGLILLAATVFIQPVGDSLNRMAQTLSNTDYYQELVIPELTAMEGRQ